MVKRKWFSIILTCWLFGLAVTPIHAKWVKLGERTVNHAVDRDEIKVTSKKGKFKRIRLRVKRRKVTFRDLKVHFGNGGVQDITLRRQIPAGGETRAIDLKGEKRVIRKVVFWYNTATIRGKRAKVSLWGAKNTAIPLYSSSRRMESRTDQI